MNEANSTTTTNTGDMNTLLNDLIKFGPKISQNAAFRKMAIAMAEKWVVKDGKTRHEKEQQTPGGVIEDQTAFNLAILHSVDRALADFKLSPATFKEASEILGRDLLVEKKPRQAMSEKFRQQYGFNQPSFLTISPSKACNLRCTGCYADADANAPHLEWDVVDKIITDARNLWADQFMVISGGEPLAYHSQGKDILDLVEKHPDVFFMMYTNGTLITPEVADRMSKLGNILPAISMEGWEERTDARRGKGVYQQVMAAMDRLFEAGVLYGVSLTATRQNAEEILSDDFINFLFNQKHALIGWIFQYMPIGRSYTLDLMPTPQQRIWMWNQTWKHIREKRVVLADFWNHGTVVDGCLSAGGHGKGGYMYVEWNGNVTPCVFVPYSPVNIKDIYARGGNLNDIYTEPFFTDIRKWQQGNQGKNLLTPCIIRDNNAVLRQFMSIHEVNPIDDNASSAIQDGDYAAGLDKYDKEYKSLADQVWQKAYLQNTPLTSAEISRLTSEAKPIQDGVKVN